MRINIDHVEAKVARVNKALGIERPAYNVPGTVALDRAYGGTAVVQICNESGGIIRLSQDGFGTLREASTFLDGMLSSLAIAIGQE